MTQVFVVTSGKYSDYHIDAIFSTKPLADRYVDLRNRAAVARSGYAEDYGVEVWDLDVGVDLLASKLRHYHIRFDRDGKSEVLSNTAPVHPDTELGWTYFNDPKQNYYGIFAIKLVAHNEKDALKIASETRAQVLTGARPPWYGSVLGTAPKFPETPEEVNDAKN